MRATSRLFANVKTVKSALLEPGTPTGLTGLATHGAPRSTLIYLYSATLDKLKGFPESSLYRQSTENLTRHRLKLVEETKPEGQEAWEGRLRKQIEERKGIFKAFGTDIRDDATTTVTSSGETGIAEKGEVTEEIMNGSSKAQEKAMLKAGQRERWNGREFVVQPVRPERNELTEEWDGEEVTDELEGIRTEEERRAQWKNFDGDLYHDQMQLMDDDLKYEPEPRLTAEQITSLEGSIGAGLLEEVIKVAEGELELVDEMSKAGIWEELEERPPEGQWKYHERPVHTATQQP